MAIDESSSAIGLNWTSYDKPQLMLPAFFHFLNIYWDMYDSEFICLIYSISCL